MKVIFDANVLISYLLTSEKEGTISTIVEAGFEGKYLLILPHEVVSELRKKITVKEYLSLRIPQPTAEKFITALCVIADIPSPIAEVIPEVGRDLKDDYLLAYGTVEECEYLVTGDEDLLVLEQVGKLKIVSPAEFYEILKKKLAEILS